MSIFSDRLVAARERRGITQRTLADELEITPTRLNYWEKGKREPDVAMIKKLSETLNVDPNFLIGLDDVNFLKTTSEEDHLLSEYRKLNDAGKQKAIENISILAKVPEYQLFPNKGKEADDSHLTAEERQRKALEDYKEILKYEKAAFGSGVQSFTPPDLTSDQIRELIKEAKKNQ